MPDSLRGEPPVDRRSRAAPCPAARAPHPLMVNLARRYGQERNDYEALSLLLQAEQHSPEDVRRGALSRPTGERQPER